MLLQTPVSKTLMPPSTRSANSRPSPSAYASIAPLTILHGRRTQAQRRGETQRRILDAAITILRAKGYAGLSTVDVANLATVSRGALTHHYPSKELLVASALEDVFVRARQQGLARAHARPTVEQALKALLDDCQDFYFGGFFRIAIELATVAGPDSEIAVKAREISAANRVPVEAAWAKALVASGLRQESAEDIVWLTGSVVRGLAVRKLLADDPKRFKRLMVLWRQMVKSHLDAAQQ